MSVVSSCFEMFGLFRITNVTPLHSKLER